MTDLESNLVAQAWTAVTGDAVERPDVEFTARPGSLPSALAAGPMATACVAATLSAAAALAAQRTGRAPRVTIDREHVADAVRSERWFRVGEAAAGSSFAPLSRFWRTGDGWVRTHANYPWHRAALLRALALPIGANPDDVASALARMSSDDVEESVFAQGGVTARVRSAAQWRGTPQGRAVRAEDLVAHDVLPGAAPRVRESRAGRPADGVRVLDLTRVIAGPVGTRMLGALGADVLRLDPVGHDDVRPDDPADTLLGKRSAAVDLTTAEGRATLNHLLGAADVLVCGYRPGALERFGLDEAELARNHPGLVIVRLAAWGHAGPWAQRRGFDSVVQAAVGIAVEERKAGGTTKETGLDTTPGALPCQLLDHGTGYLAAAAALDGLRRQAAEGGTHVRRLSLARTAAWLLDADRPVDVDPPALEPSGGLEHTVRLSSGRGEVTAVAPPGRFDGTDLTWPPHATGYLADPPTWRRRG